MTAQDRFQGSGSESRAVSRRSVLRAGAVAAGALAVPAVAGAQSAAGVAAAVEADGTVWAGGLGFNRNGQVVELVTNGVRQTLTSPGGLFIREPQTDQQYAVTGKIVRRGGQELHQRTVIDELSVLVDVTYRPAADGTVDVDGAVRDLAGRDRVLDSVFALPLPVASGVWGANSARPRAFDATAVSVSQLAVPLATVSNTGTSLGVAYAIPPDKPCRFEMALQPGSEASTFTVRQMWGLSRHAAGALRGRAPFAFTVDLDVDPDWGFRSALRRYYDRSPEWFMNPAGEPVSEGGEAYGTWQFVPRSFYAEPNGNAFHMAGRGLWDKETGAMATTLAEYAANDEWNADEEAGVRILPYTIPGQREITGLDSPPQGYEEAVQAFEAWTDDPIPFAAANLTNSYESADIHREVIENSSLRDPDGRYVINIRNTPWGGNSVTFPTNPNPNLYANDPSRRTIGRHLLEEYVPQMLADPRVDGIFSDSLYNWGWFWDYSKDHFPAATIPLTYTTSAVAPPNSSPRGIPYVPGLMNDFSVVEYLWKLRDLLHSKNKILMTNGLRFRDRQEQTRAFAGFASDVIGVEFRMDWMFEDGGADDPSDLSHLRDVAYQRPVTLTLHNDANSDWTNPTLVDQVWKRCLLYGEAPAGDGTTGSPAFAAAGPIDPDMAGEQGVEAEFQRMYIGTFRTLLNAGWEPLTGVRTSVDLNEGPRGVRVERYGTGQDFYLVLYNQYTDTKTASFDVDRSLLPGIDSPNVIDIMTGEPPAQDLLNALRGQGSVQMESEQFHVLHFQP